MINFETDYGTFSVSKISFDEIDQYYSSKCSWYDRAETLAFFQVGSSVPEDKLLPSDYFYDEYHFRIFEAHDDATAPVKYLLILKPSLGLLGFLYNLLHDNTK